MAKVKDKKVPKPPSASPGNDRLYPHTLKPWQFPERFTGGYPSGLSYYGPHPDAPPSGRLADAESEFPVPSGPKPKPIYQIVPGAPMPWEKQEPPYRKKKD